MSKARILYVSQHMVPFLPETPMSSISRFLPQGAHDKGKEIRVFMPRFGKINERRHQLHEVIRLSGMNLSIDDVDHPLIIKVASIPTARMQVYFIDNDDLFKRKAVLYDADDKLFADTDVRSIFFVRGVLETVRKLGWAPDVIHCQGWMTNLLPLYLKTNYADDPYFSNCKVVCSIYNEGFGGSLDKRMSDKLVIDGISEESANTIKKATFDNINALGIEHADALIVGSDNLNTETIDKIKSAGVPILDFPGNDGYLADVNAFYDEILGVESEETA
ncbi:MAG: glycogen synthase [Crocinitomicaceae bacterium]|nr:glycogen synthase [Crocinitomicaceae bacterium]|tara:strand:- start:10441 stop:11268 length:828 start_codon:yes stop_codon:yes gene_type:complete